MIATFKVAVQEGLPLFSDDMCGRNLARDRYGTLPSVGIQWILLNLRATKQLSNEGYFEAVLKLIHAGYGFIWVSIAFFLWVVRRDNHEVTDDVRAVLRTLSLWKTVDSLAVALSAGVLTALWKENLLEHRRQALVKAVLDALVEERDTFQVTQML